MHCRAKVLDQKDSLCVFVNKFQNIDENGLKRVDDMVTAVIPKSIKGDNLVKMHLRVVAYVQNVALVLLNKYVKFDEESFNGMEAMAMAMAMSVFFKVLKGR